MKNNTEIRTVPISFIIPLPPFFHALVFRFSIENAIQTCEPKMPIFVKQTSDFFVMNDLIGNLEFFCESSCEKNSTFTLNFHPPEKIESLLLSSGHETR